VLRSSPGAVTLHFADRLNPDFTTIVVSDSIQRRASDASPAIKGDTAVLTLGEPLPNGVYTIAYRTVSVDGHVVQGSYRFTLADPAKPAAITEASAPAPAAITSAPKSRTLGPIADLTGGVVAAACAGVFVHRRRKARPRRA